MYCEELTCNLNDFEFYQPSLHLVLPQNRSLAVGETIEIPCANDTSGTSIEVTCKKYGYLDPHPTTVTCQSEADKEEEQRVHSSCAECYAPGTDKCVEVSGGFVCECREHWTGLTCWKAPNQCELQQIACEHGTCESQVDQAVCKCDESFAGEHCTVNRTQLSWFSYDGSSIISVQTFSAAILFCTELALTIAYIFVDQRSELKDPQLFYQEARSFEMAIAGLVVLLYRHPAMLNLHTYECGMYFFVATSLFSVGIGLLTFEAYNGYETASLKQLNNWRVDFQLKERWSLSLGLRVLPTVIVMSGAVALVYFSMKEKVTSSWSCLGNFSSDAINFWFPLALLNTIAAIGATAFSYKGLFTRMHIPQYDKVLEAYLKTCPVHLRNDIEKCHRNLIFSALLSWMLLGCWLFLGISNDDVVEFVPNCFALMFTLLYCATDVLQFVVTTPSLYSKMMWASIRILPCHLSPSMDPVSQWSKREILASYERGNAEIKRNWYNPCRKGYLPLCVRCQIEDEWSEKYETLRMNHGNKTKASIMFVIRQDSVEYHLINEKNPAVRNTIRRLFRQWSAATYRNDPNPDASLRPKTELERQLEEIAELKRSLLFYNGPGSAEMTGWSDEPLNDNNNAKNLANEASLVLTIDCYGNTELKLVLKTPVEIIDEEDFLASSIDGRSDDFDCQEDHTSTYDDEMTLTRRRHDCLKEESETVFQMAVQNQDYLERLLSLRSW